MSQLETNRVDDRSPVIMQDGSKVTLDCPVCDNCMFGRTNVVAEGCGHVVCKSCAIKWIKTGYKHCPKCRDGGSIANLTPVFIEEPTFKAPEPV